MNKPETISSFQMSMLFLSFMTGSAIINIPAPLTGAAKNGAWLSIIIANALGFLLLACVLYLHRQYPALTFIDYSRKALGSVLTFIIAVPLILLLFQILSNIVTDIAGFFNTTMMQETPSYVFFSLILMTAALTSRAGIEVMARMFILLLSIMYLFTIVVILLTIPYYNAEFLLPVMPDGIKPILHATYIAWGFPYSELLMFTMILPFVSKEQDNSLSKFMFLALLVNGISLIIVIICTIATVGSLSGDLKFSLYQVARLISVQDIIERIESIIGIAIITGSYMKATIVLFVINLALSQLLRLQNPRILTFPIALVTMLLSLTMYNNEMEFIENVTVIGPLIITVLGVIPVVLITIITLLKKKKAN